eukprot:6203027-Pleurochrysis_carterae.AAC.1
MAARMPDSDLEEWVRPVLLEEESLGLPGRSAPTTWILRGIIGSAAVDSLTQEPAGYAGSGTGGS